MICPRCQKEVDPSLRFCGHCGAELYPAQAAPAPQGPPSYLPQNGQQVPPPAYYPPLASPAGTQVPANLRSQAIGAGLVILGVLLPWYSLGFVGISGFDIITLAFNVSRWGSLFGVYAGDVSAPFILAAVLMILIILSGVTGFESISGSARGRSRARRAGWIGLLVLIGLAILLLSQIPFFPGIGLFVTLAGMICMITLGRG